MLTRVWAIVRREYLERVRSKAFIVGTVLGPILMTGLTVIPGLVMAKTGKPLHISIVDETLVLRPGVEAALARHRLGNQARFVIEALPAGEGSARDKALKDTVIGGRLDGYLQIPKEAADRNEATYFGKTVSNMGDIQTMASAVSEALVAYRLGREGVDTSRVAQLTRRADLKPVRLSLGGEREDRGLAVVVAVVLFMILYTTVLMWGQVVMTSVIEEKSSRVVEVLASTVPAQVLLAGKLLGVGAAGLTQFLVWAFSLAGLSVASAGFLATLGQGAVPEISPLMLAAFVAFFLLGYLLYSAMFAAVGAAVNTTQEAQSLVFIVVGPLIAAVVMFPAVLQAPDGPLATALSLFPLFTPLHMFLRMAILPPPAWQVALSMALTAATTAGMVWIAARIYRVGILMYGKRPTFPEILRWVRHT
jgi:ABC-2 type transport system permease protein